MPYLCEERIALGYLAVVPWCREALRTPMAAEKDKRRRCFETVAELTLPFQRSAPVALHHAFAETFAATEGSSLLHVLDGPLIARLSLIETVVKVQRSLGRRSKILLLPWLDGLPFLARAIVSHDAVLNIVFDPPLSAPFLSVSKWTEHHLEYKRRAECREMVEPRHLL